MRVFQCEGTTDGILTAVYEAWASRLGHENVRLQVKGADINMELFAEYEQVQTDSEKAGKVARTIRRELGFEAWQGIFQASLSSGPDRADCIYRTVVEGLTWGKGHGGIMKQLQHPAICRVFELSRQAGREAHQYLGFVRFRELGGKILFSEIHPKARILPLIGDHFAERFPMENFSVYDSCHEEFLVHQAGKPWVLMQGANLNRERLEALTQEEEQFQALWRAFVDTIAIEARANPDLQTQMLPKRFRPYMTEWGGTGGSGCGAVRGSLMA